MAEAAYASLREKCNKAIAQHFRLLDEHIRALKKIDHDIARYVTQGILSTEYANRTREALRPIAERTVQMRRDANQDRGRLSACKRVREDGDKTPVFDGVPSSGQLLKRRKLTTPSPQPLEEQACGQHTRLDEPMTDVVDADNTDGTSDTVSPEMDDINELVENRLKLQRKRRAQRIDNPELLSPTKDATSASSPKRKRMSDGNADASAVELRSNKGTVASERASKRKKDVMAGATMQERAESLRQRSRDFFIRAAEVENAAVGERARQRSPRAGTRGARIARLRRDVEGMKLRGA